MNIAENTCVIRFPTHEVAIGNRPLGGRQPIRLQSMTNTNTLDIDATVAQSIRIIEAGADYVRISAPNQKAADALGLIKNKLRAAGFSHPLIADIHFNPEVALAAARLVEKVRINPGNYTGAVDKNKVEFSREDIEKDKETIYNRIKPLIEVCKQEGTAIRIGTNLGSLSPRIIAQYGNTPKGMVEATFEFLEIFGQLGFHNLIISLKASKPLIMVQAYEGMVEKMLANNLTYPLHIGITEAGEGENGRIKSVLGISGLLNKGIGDTVRVSLTEDPELEIPFAHKIIKSYHQSFSSPSTDRKFTLLKSDFNSEEITFEGKKGIVITTKTTKDNSSDISFNADLVLHKTDTLNSNDQYAGLLSTNNSDINDHYTEYQTIKTNDLINRLKSEKIEYLIKPTFVLVDATDVIPDIKALEGIDIVGIIMDLDDRLSGFVSSEWAQFCQDKKIPLILAYSSEKPTSDDIVADFGKMASNLLIEKKAHGILLQSYNKDIDIESIAFGFLQSASIRITKTEFISCPTCARTSYNLMGVIKNIQQHTSQIPGLKLAVMGCIVNGPGEMADADFGFVGTGTGKLHLYKGKEPILKNIETADAVSVLLSVLRDNGYIV